MMRTYNVPTVGYGADWGDIHFKTYKHDYPTFDDENNLSLAVFVQHPNLKVLFPGDMETEGWQLLLENPDFVADLKTTDILVASHHGRDNGCCEELFRLTGWNPQLVVISDSEIIYGTQETTTEWYRRRCLGRNVGEDNRHVLTTRKDGTIYLSTTVLDFTVETSVTKSQGSALLAALAGTQVFDTGQHANGLGSVWSGIGQPDPQPHSAQSLLRLADLAQPTPVVSSLLFGSILKK